MTSLGLKPVGELGRLQLEVGLKARIRINLEAPVAGIDISKKDKLTIL
ncbi:hypothetical protein [Saccharolobus caldissimus]|nr:hypothetical protein [Saccharolobus caldissimus]